MTEHDPLGFDGPDPPPDPEIGPDDGPKAARPIPRRPYCPRHNVLLAPVQDAAKPSDRFRCPVPGCETDAATGLIPKRRTRPPDRPLACPHCNPAGQPPTVFARVDTQRTGRYLLAMTCDRCGWTRAVDRPDIAYQATRARRRRGSDLLSR